MISESFYWKNELLKQAQDLRRRLAQRRWVDASYARVEQTVMLGFYTIRKLIEAKRISTSTAQRAVHLSAYPATGNPVTLINLHKIERNYDLETRRRETLSLLHLCHQFIHSYIFMVVRAEDGGLHGFLFCSDRMRKQMLFEISAEEVIALFEHVAQDYPNSVQMQINPKTGDFDVKAEVLPEAE